MPSTIRLCCCLVLCVALLGLSACKQKREVTGAGKGNPEISNPTAKAPATPPGHPEKPGHPPHPKAQPPKAKVPLHAGAHILIAYVGARRAMPNVKRTKEQASKFAKELTAKLRKSPATFKESAQKHSNGPSGPQGGILGVWPKGQMVPEFDVAIAKMKVDEISDPVETPFGFHVIKRLPIYSGAHILVSYKGARMARPTVTRTKEQAQARAKELTEQARKAPDTFAELAKKNSEGPSAKMGGSLRFWAKGKMVPEFDKAIEGLKIGEVSDPVKTAFGWHVIKRNAPPDFAP